MESHPHSKTLDEFLRSHKEVGLAHGEGRFSVDLNSARDKLAHFNLPPDYWVLRVVQAAAVWGSEEVEFTYLRNDLGISFLIPVVRQIEKIVQGLGNPGTRTPETDLSIALLSASTTGKPVHLAVETSGSRQEAIIEKGTISLSEPTNLEGKEKGTKLFIQVPRTRTWPTLAQMFREPLVDLLRRTVTETSLLRETARYSVCRLKLDGSQLESYTNQHFSPTWHFQFRPAHFELPPVARGLGVPRKSLSLESIGRNLFRNPMVFSDDPYLVQRVEEARTGGFISLLFSLKESDSRLSFVHRGAVVKSFSTSLYGSPKQFIRATAEKETPCLRIVVELEDRDLDLSGFGIRDLESVLQRTLEHYRVSFLKLIEQGRDLLQELRWEQRARPRNWDTAESKPVGKVERWGNKIWHPMRKKDLEAVHAILKEKTFGELFHLRRDS